MKSSDCAMCGGVMVPAKMCGSCGGLSTERDKEVLILGPTCGIISIKFIGHSEDSSLIREKLLEILQREEEFSQQKLFPSQIAKFRDTNRDVKILGTLSTCLGFLKGTARYKAGVCSITFTKLSESETKKLEEKIIDA